MLLLGRGRGRAAGGRGRPCGGAPSRWPSTSPGPTPASGSSAPARSASAGSTCWSTTPARARSGRSRSSTDEEWQSQWEIHVMAPMRLMRAAIPVMVRGRVGEGGQRLLVLGQAARPAQRRLLGDQGRRAVAVARLRRRLRRHGVLVNAVTPGPVASELWLGPGGLADQTAEARGTREEVLAATAARAADRPARGPRRDRRR